MRTTYPLFIVLSLLAALAANPATAKESPLDFLHLMQDDYPDIAVDYLNQLKADPSNAPKEIMDLWDLEMSRSMKKAAAFAYSPAQARQWTEESKALLEKFIKANPGLPEAIQEAARWAEQQAMEGQYKILRATYVSDKAEKAQLLADARKIFEDIRPQFEKALNASINLQKSLTPKTSPKKVIEAITMVGENRLTVAMVDFYLAQTQEEGARRTEALNKSIKDFDGIYQDFREKQNIGEAFIGWKAHFFHGRILQELGNFKDAKDIYEEVVSCDERNIEEMDESRTAVRTRALRRTGMEGFFADVEQYFLQTLCQLDKKEYLEEVERWRSVHKANSEKCFGFQALTLEYARNALAMTAQSKEETKEKAKKKALSLLNEMAKIASPYQQDAVKLRRELNPNIGTSEAGFEDAVVDGKAAWDDKKWAEAAECFEKALAAAAKNPKTDKQRLAEVQNTLVACYHNMALDLYRAKKVDEAIAMAKKALKGPFLHTKAAPGLAVFMLNAQYYQYLAALDGTDAEKRDTLLAKVTTSAKAILSIKDWASKEEGDSARIILLRLAMAKDNMAEADKILSEINPSSKEYPKALMVMGFAHWFKYKMAKKHLAPEEAQMKADKEAKAPIDKAKLAALQKAQDARDEDRKQALDTTEKAVKALDTPRTADAPLPEGLRDLQLLLAEIYSEGQDFKQAWSLYKVLIDGMLKGSNNPFDDEALRETALRIFDGGSQACLQLGEVESVAEIGPKFVELAPDQAQINLRLLSFAKGLDNLRKRVMESETTAPAGHSEGGAKLKAVIDLEEKIMISLSKRENITSASLIWIVRTVNNLGTDDAKAAAAELIEKIVAQSKADKTFYDEVQKALPSLQSLGALIEAERKNFAKAQELILGLIKTYPRALEPRVSEARILTEWARSKDSSKYAEAIGKWDSLREKLERISKNTPAGKLDPKYEVILNEAECFFLWAQKMNNKDEGKEYAKKAMGLLNPYLSLDPHIQAPEEEYKELSIKYYRLGGKLAEFLGVQRPVRPAKVKRPATGK